MAESTFYCSWEDTLAILEALVNLKRFTFIVDLPDEEPELYQFEELSAKTLEILNKHTTVYLWSKDFSQFPPITPIFPIRSGPALELFLGKEKEKDGLLRLGYGSLHYQSYYQNPDTNEIYRPPEKLKQAYKGVQSLMHKFMEKRYKLLWVADEKSLKQVVDTYWIGKHGIQLLEREEAIIGYGSEFWVTAKDLKKKKEDLIFSS